MQSNDSTFRPAFTLMSGRVLAFAVTFLTPVLLVRVFSQAEFGTYKQFTLVAYTLYLIGQLGLAECLFYFVPANPQGSARYALNSLLMLGVSGIVCLVGLLLTSSFIAERMRNPALADYAPIMGFFVLFMLMGTVLEITMITRKRYRLAAVTYVVSDVLRMACLVVPAYVTRSLGWALIGSVVFLLLRVCAIFPYFHHEFGGGLRMDKQLLKAQWAYALPFSLSVVVQVIQSNYHQYAIAFNFDAATFAIYSVGCLQIPLVDFMATPASNVMMVRMAEEVRDGHPRRLLPIWHDTTRKLALLFFPFVGLLVSNAYHLITFLFTRNYVASVPIFMVWSLSILAAAFQSDGVLRVFAQMRFLFATNLVRLAAVVLLMGFFLSTFHLMGAVLITLLGIVIAKMMALVRMKKLLDTSFSQLLPWKNLGGILMVAMLAAVPALIVNARLDAHALIVLPIAGMAYMVTYVVLVLVSGLLSEGEKAKLNRSLYVWNRRSPESGREAGL
jgi:O-antigen/teichoic acid export membrane protein